MTTNGVVHETSRASVRPSPNPAASTGKPPILHDRGLGTAYERFHFYRLLDTWASRYEWRTMLEGPVDGMAGVPGVHGVGLARRGIQVTSVVATDAQARATKEIYASSGGGKNVDVRVMSDPNLVETLPKSDVVLVYHALSFVNDWPKYLKAAASRANKSVVVAVCNPNNWGLVAIRFIGRLRKIAGMEPPPEWYTETLAPELWALGRVREHVYFDCPWWPDSPGGAGQTLKDRAASVIFTKKKEIAFAASDAQGPLAQNHVYGAENWPYFGGSGWRHGLSSAIRRHPSFENAPDAVKARVAHLHAFVVDVTPRTPQARRKLKQVD